MGPGELVALQQVRDERDCLDGFPQTHLVCQDAVHFVVDQRGHEAEARDLVGPQFSTGHEFGLRDGPVSDRVHAAVVLALRPEQMLGVVVESFLLGGVVGGLGVVVVLDLPVEGVGGGGGGVGDFVDALFVVVAVVVVVARAAVAVVAAARALFFSSSSSSSSPLSICLLST